jgi:hypothetical protein
MTRVDLERRLACLATRLLRPPTKVARPPELAWLEWVSNCELDAIEKVARAEAAGLPLSEREQLLLVEVEAAAIRRQLSGWPSYYADRSRYGEVDLTHERDGLLTLRPRRRL